MTKVTVNNFQSIKSIDFDIDGFTVIVGKNNIGKSAIIRAIDAALTNQVGDSYIRLGEKSTEVNIKRDDIDIHWKKGDKSQYKVNGESYSNLNRAIPKPMSEAGFGTMEIGDEKVNPLIAHQFEPLFLLNRRGSVVTEVLSALYNFDKFSVADDLCQKELKGQKSSLKVRELDLKALQVQLDNFKDFDDIKKSVEELVKEEESCNLLKAQIVDLTTYETSLKSLHNRVRNIEPIKDVFVPDYIDCETLLSGFKWLEEKEQQVLSMVRSISRLKYIDQVNPPDYRECIDLIENYQWIKDKEEDLGFLAQEVKKLREITCMAIPEDKDIETLMQDVATLFHWEGSLSLLTKGINDQEKWLQIIDSLISSTNINDIETTLKDCSRIADVEEEFMTVASQAKKSREEIKAITSDLELKQTELAKINVCPLCERPF